MLLPPEYSAFVVAANLVELEDRFDYFAEETSLVASYLAETDPELGRLTKLCDEIKFAARNVGRGSQPLDVQTAAEALSSTCEGVTVFLFDFRRHHDGTQTDMDVPHQFGSDLIVDMIDEIGENWDSITTERANRRSEVFRDLRGRATDLRDVLPHELANFYDLGHLFSIASKSVSDLKPKDRFDKVQQQIIPDYQALFAACCRVRPSIGPCFTESIDDDRLKCEFRDQRQRVRDILRNFESLSYPGSGRLGRTHEGASKGTNKPKAAELDQKRLDVYLDEAEIHERWNQFQKSDGKKSRDQTVQFLNENLDVDCNADELRNLVKRVKGRTFDLRALRDEAERRRLQ